MTKSDKTRIISPTSVTIENTEKRTPVVKVHVGNMRVLHGSAPPLHAHCHVSNLYCQKLS